VPQRSRPYFLLIELQLYGRIPNLVFDNPESIDDLRKFAHQMTYKQIHSLVWELNICVLSLYPIHNLFQTIQHSHHRNIESPIMQQPSKMEVARTI